MQWMQENEDALCASTRGTSSPLLSCSTRSKRSSALATAPWRGRIKSTASRAARERRASLRDHEDQRHPQAGRREARVVAAEEGRSISALLTDRLEAIVRERKAFDRAKRRALARLREGLDLQWTPPKSRDELHER